MSRISNATAEARRHDAGAGEISLTDPATRTSGRTHAVQHSWPGWCELGPRIEHTVIWRHGAACHMAPLWHRAHGTTISDPINVEFN